LLLLLLLLLACLACVVQVLSGTAQRKRVRRSSLQDVHGVWSVCYFDYSKTA
jgi:hypothetical protein